MLILLTLAILAAAFFSWRHYTISTLRWPKNMGFPTFQARVKWMLKRHGWIFVEVRKFPRPLIARKGNTNLMIVCLHSKDSMTPMKLADLDDGRRSAGSRQVICITNEPLTKAFRALALEKRIYVMYYKEIKSFVMLPSSNADVVTNYFSDMNSKT
jgi:hypothetical protein